MAQLGIDFMISSANKCIQGVPGFGFILARRSLLEQCKGVARSLSLDLYDQWETMEKDMENGVLPRLLMWCAPSCKLSTN